MTDSREGALDALALIGAIHGSDAQAMGNILSGFDATAVNLAVALADMLITQLKKQDLDVAEWVARGQEIYRSGQA